MWDFESDLNAIIWKHMWGRHERAVIFNTCQTWEIILRDIVKFEPNFLIQNLSGFHKT